MKHTEETKQKIKKKLLGRKLSESTIAKMRGRKSWNKGKKLSYPVWNKCKSGLQTAWNKGKRYDAVAGEKNGNWKGGIALTERKKEILAGRSKPMRCEVCGSLGRICFDHDHKTGQFRGWICVGCNSALGYVKDNPELLILLADYLRRTAAKGLTIRLGIRLS